MQCDLSAPLAASNIFEINLKLLKKGKGFLVLAVFATHSGAYLNVFNRARYQSPHVN